MYEKQLPPLPPQSAQDRMSSRTVVGPPQPLSQRNPLGYVNRQAQPGSDILTSLEQEILKLRRENDALRRSMVEKETKIEMLQNLNSQHRQQIDEQTRQTAQLFQTRRSAIETYQDDKKDQAGHLPQRSPGEIVSGAFSDRKAEKIIRNLKVPNSALEALAVDVRKLWPSEMIEAADYLTRIGETEAGADAAKRQEHLAKLRDILGKSSDSGGNSVGMVE